MKRTIVTRALTLLLLALALAACGREPPADEGGGTAGTGDGATGPAVALVDVVETTPDYVIGISYPQSAGKYPEVAARLKRYADAAKTGLMQAVSGRPGDSAALYDLSLSFTEIVDTPVVVAYAADGSSYTGGAHGMPLLARFVWLPQRGEMLAAAELIPRRDGWEAIARYIREQLYAALSQQLDAEELEPAVRAEQMENAGRMIDDGTAPDPDNFSQFEPVVGGDGRIVALRFVFAPYQVAPYAAGVQGVEVPAAVLLPHVAAGYRDLFAVAGQAPGSAPAAPGGAPGTSGQG